jgi:hypothetical protein
VGSWAGKLLCTTLRQALMMGQQLTRTACKPWDVQRSDLGTGQSPRCMQREDKDSVHLIIPAVFLRWIVSVAEVASLLPASA